MENKLDAISEGQAVWYEEIKAFYDQFAPLIENARDNMVKLYPKMTDEFCPECGLPLFIRRGPFGEFTACSGYPHCKYIKKKPKVEPVRTGHQCPLCKEGELVERINVRGRNKGTLFYACSLFPKCRATYSGLPNGEICEVCNGPMIVVNDEVVCGNEKCKTNRERRAKERQEAKKVIS
jgi:DNA topoisomerase-1